MIGSSKESKGSPDDERKKLRVRVRFLAWQQSTLDDDMENPGHLVMVNLQDGIALEYGMTAPDRGTRKEVAAKITKDKKKLPLDSLVTPKLRDVNDPAYLPTAERRPDTKGSPNTGPLPPPKIIPGRKADNKTNQKTGNYIPSKPLMIIGMDERSQAEWQASKTIDDERIVPKFTIVHWFDTEITADEFKRLESNAQFRHDEGGRYVFRKEEVDQKFDARCLTVLEDLAEMRHLELGIGRAIKLLRSFVEHMHLDPLKEIKQSPVSEYLKLSSVEYTAPAEGAKLEVDL